MKHDHSQYTVLTATPAYAAADAALVEDRVRRFTPLVRKTAWQVQGDGAGPLDFDDLVQVGMLALTRCAQRHSGPSEDGFAAYAKLRVRGAMIDAIRQAVPGSRGSAQRRRQEDAAQTLPACSPAARTISLAAAYNDASSDFADPTPDAFAQLSETEDGERLAAMVAALPERLQLVIQLYFLEELSLAEIAAVLEVSVPRVHQLKAQGLARLRAQLAR